MGIQSNIILERILLLWVLQPTCCNILYALSTKEKYARGGRLLTHQVRPRVSIITFAEYY